MANLRKQVDVPHFIARISEALLRLLLPGTGRRRSPGAPTVLAAREDGSTRFQPPGVPFLRGEDSPLVRPYLVAHERREEERQQRARRRALWFAVYGIDLGPRRIHGVEVTAS